MDYKQYSPTLVVRTSDGKRVLLDDPMFVTWLAAGNCPFPPDPPSPEEIAALEASLP